MKLRIQRFLTTGILLGLSLAGCTTISPLPETQSSLVPLPTSAHLLTGKRTLVAKPTSDDDPIRLVSAVDPDTNPGKGNLEKGNPNKDKNKDDIEELPRPKKATDADTTATDDPAETPTTRKRPEYARLETLPIDLPSVIRLVDAKNPAIQFAAAKVREAQARLAQAEVQWLPNVSTGLTYLRYDGQTQNQRGEVFGVSRSNLFLSGGPSLTLDLADAIYRPLVERRMAGAEELRSTAIMNNVELEAVSAYLDLLGLYAQREINRDTLTRAEEMLTAAKNATEAKLDRTAGDVNRARTEVLLRRAEGLELEGRLGIASARLGRLLQLQPNVKLAPAEPFVTPVTLIDPHLTLDDLLRMALTTRPDLASHRETIAAAWARVQRQEYGPFLPKFSVQDQAGEFGGGQNANLEKFSSRNALSVQLFWEIKNLGFGNHAELAERRAMLDQAHIALVDTQARLAAEIVEAAQLAAAKFETLDLAERTVKESAELYRITKEGVMNVVDPKNLFDALRPLQAVQLLNQARMSYLAAVLEYSRAQYRLFVLIGRAPRELSPK